MSKKKYIIRYKLDGSDEYCYSSKITDNATHSVGNKYSVEVTKMTLEEAEKNVEKIIKLRAGRTHDIVRNMRIIDTETNKMIRYKTEEITRFELMEL